MSKDASSQPKNSFAFWQELRGYLKTKMEFGSKVKITVSNTAPQNVDGPTVVFTGVGLSVGDLRERDLNLPTWARQIERHKVDAQSTQGKQEEKRDSDRPSWQDDTEMKSLLKINYRRMDEKDFPDTTRDEQQNGDILFPGQSIIYEFSVPLQDIPYIKFRVEGTASRRHLFHYRETLVMPEVYTRPVVLAVMRAFNAIDVHKVLDFTIASMPDFSSDTKLADIQTFVTALSTSTTEIKATQEALNDVYRKHPIAGLRVHLRAAFIYLDNVSVRLTRIRQAIASSNSGEIAAAARDLRAMQNVAAQLNRATEELMRSHNVSDEEVNYRYRGR